MYAVSFELCHLRAADVQEHDVLGVLCDVLAASAGLKHVHTLFAERHDATPEPL